MRIRKKLFCSFLIITLIPSILLVGTCKLIYQFQLQSVLELDNEFVGVTKILSNPIQFMNSMTADAFATVKEKAPDCTSMSELISLLKPYEKSMQKRYSFFILKYNGIYTYNGNDTAFAQIRNRIPSEAQLADNGNTGLYVSGENSFLIKSYPFSSSNGSESVIYVVTMVNGWLPALKAILVQFAISFLFIILFTAGILLLWIYGGIVRPLNELRKATHKMRDGDLDFSIDTTSQDEIGILCQDFEELRKHLKESNEIRLRYEREMRELVSNISHDLKTPLTAIEGYSEGLLDGIATTPEKQERYLRIIHTKAKEMALLVDELSESSKIENGIVPYHFRLVKVVDYFRDCIEDLRMDLLVQNVTLRYENHVAPEIRVVMDPEQVHRVINNIVGNSVKYFPTKEGTVWITVTEEPSATSGSKEKEEHRNEKNRDKSSKDRKTSTPPPTPGKILVEIKDNGSGISPEALPHIFDRLYRADASRHSGTGGSGLGLAIAKKIIEEHGGQIWAESEEGHGTSIFFTLYKEQLEPEQKMVSGLLGGKPFL